LNITKKFTALNKYFQHKMPENEKQSNSIEVFKKEALHKYI